MPLVSFVVPTLRENALADALTRLSERLVTFPRYTFEILLTDDSPESYKQALDEAASAHNARFAPQVTARRVDGPRRGKGGAIRAGVLASQGELVFTMDADLPVPLENIERFLSLFEAGNDVMVAERPMSRNASEPVRFVASRALFVLQWAVVFQAWLFADTQCGFKAFRGSLARTLASRQVVEGGMVDIEYLYAAVRSGARIARVPVIPNPETRESRINVKRALWQDPVDLVRIKLGGLLGRYD